MTSSNDDGQSNGNFEGYVFKSCLDAAVVVDEKFYGLTSSNHKPLPDVVSMQGRFLRPRPETPTFDPEYYPDFARKLAFLLDGVPFRQKVRRRKYGEEIVEEWIEGHTPIEIREKWISEQEKKMKQHDAILENPTPPTPEDERRAKEERMAAERDKARLVWEKYKAIKKQKKRKAAELSSSSTQTLPNPRKRQMPS
ncbi:hypothetical protein McanMca71_001284 [Microsporum canis]